MISLLPLWLYVLFAAPKFSFADHGQHPAFQCPQCFLPLCKSGPQASVLACLRFKVIMPLCFRNNVHFTVHPSHRGRLNRDGVLMKKLASQGPIPFTEQGNSFLNLDRSASMLSHPSSITEEPLSISSLRIPRMHPDVHDYMLFGVILVLVA
ncbi:hypothetical protein Nepgr_020649 [Nepenthes gracilis]|uniref:Secreted protein n=1 Tax=Nepenthes gracilis TaxID=150966 RepID=A0AAD3XVE6_NEPGR|nr:hypothetical protein Nepgr_020649 [Nepenthes gracilis]